MDKRKSWESLSSDFSNIDISASPDSCYSSSDKTSDSTCASSATVPSFVSAAASSLHPLLHSILKKPHPTADEEKQFESESGYGSIKFDNASDTSIVGFSGSEDEDEDEDDEEENDVCYVTRWGQASSKIINPLLDTSSPGDDSFIGFEATVRFDLNVQYIEPPTLTPRDENDDAMPEVREMTFHEMMEISRASGREGEEEEEETRTSTADDVDLDKRLFVAYVNGMDDIMDHCAAHIQHCLSDMRQGRIRSPFLEVDQTGGLYIDQMLRHVIRVFPKLVVQDELNELAGLQERKKKALEMGGHTETRQAAVQQCTRALLDKIRRVLMDKLTRDNVEMRDDTVSFFAGGVAYAFEQAGQRNAQRGGHSEQR